MCASWKGLTLLLLGAPQAGVQLCRGALLLMSPVQADVASVSQGSLEFFTWAPPLLHNGGEWVPGLCPKELCRAGPWSLAPSASWVCGTSVPACGCRGHRERQILGALEPDCLPWNLAPAAYQLCDLGQTTFLTSFSKPRLTPL